MSRTVVVFFFFFFRAVVLAFSKPDRGFLLGTAKTNKNALRFEFCCIKLEACVIIVKRQHLLSIHLIG